MKTNEKCAIVRYSRKKADLMSRKEEIMNTVLFANYLNSEKFSEVLRRTWQDVVFVYSYKVRQRQKTVCDTIGI